MRASVALLLLIGAACTDITTAPVTPPVIDPPTGSTFAEGLWTISGNPSEILRLGSPDLLVDGSRTPDTRLSTSGAGLFLLNSIAFDEAGTMWVASSDDAALLGFAANGEGPAGMITPSITIGSVNGSLTGPTGIAFARDGSLWVASFGSGKIVRYHKDQLKTSGFPEPSMVITGVPHPTGLAFDATGALWVTDHIESTVSRYVPGQLFSSGEKTPTVVLSSSAESLVNPSGIAFDSFNNMWIANTGSDAVVEFRPPQRASSGAPEPVVRLTAPGSSLGSPAGVAFDQIGNLWITGAAGIVSKFTIQDIAASGPAAPSVRVEVADHLLLWSIAFWPKPSGFPLN